MKKSLKKTMTTAAIAVLLSLALVFSAFAGNFNHLADELNALGLFQGTGAGYDLERAPNRIEALVMTLRFMGLEEAALEGDYEHPFNDVPAWADPYVAYAFEYGLTQGVSDTRFGASDLCTAQMYVTFILRALGFSDAAGGDFTYAGAIAFGSSKGIIDPLLASGTFTRDEMVAVSHLALAVAPKDGEFDTLLAKLVADGAVTEATAAPLLRKQALFDEFNSVGAELNDDPSVSMAIKMEMDMGQLGSASAAMELSMIIDGTDITAAIITAIVAEGEEITVEMFIADGFLYMNQGGEKVKLDAGFANIEELLSMSELSAMAHNPSYFYKDITKTTEGSYTVYTVTLADSFIDIAMGLAAGMMGNTGINDPEMMDLMADMSIDISAVKFYANAAGDLVRMVMPMSMTLDMGALGALTLTIGVDMEITAVGDAVTVNLPDDLDEYELLSIG